jgi:hypothetical protein
MSAATTSTRSPVPSLASAVMRLAFKANMNGKSFFFDSDSYKGHQLQLESAKLWVTVCSRPARVWTDI